MNASTSASFLSFGDFLKRLRKRAGMTQDDLAAAIGYSRSLVGALESNQRLPDVEVVIQTFVPALALQDEPLLAAQLIELAALSRGQRPPPSLTLMREHRRVMTPATDEMPLRLPVPPTDILGRDRESNHLCNRVLGHHGRLLTLVGPPGVGKTRLALAVGSEVQALYRDGACFVPLAPVTDPALLASTLGYRPVGPIGQLADAALGTVRVALDPALFAEAFGAGEQMSLEALGPLLAPGSTPPQSPVASILS